ncbi:MAG: rhodanese-like domain-containing protein [Gammaproteobacteria bacterium]|nr:rhodanese-like domain-containing protein [Gammaproteobacteria bacterium]
MKYFKIVSMLYLLIAGSVIAGDLSPQKNLEQSTIVQESREQKTWQLIEAGALIVDARTAQEYAAGHLEGAINIPFDVAVSLFKTLDISKNRDIVLYCRSGNRSGMAFESLTKAGYTNLHNGGGLNAILAAKPEIFSQ